MEKEPDEWLMQQVALGQRQYLAPLVRRYGSSLLTFIMRMVGDRHQAEELFQEVFLTVWLKRKQYRFPGRFRSWIYTIAANRCRAEFRRVRPPTEHLDQDLFVAATSDSPVELAVATETEQLVTIAITQLPTKQRAAVVLRIWNGLSYAEIAESLNCSEATARSHMHHGLNGLRRFLETRT